ncbi:MAG: 16S rRNA (cytidine(1402)-2'-O)-methyltransferase [Clostridiales bacterium]|nr:16S rRNA (cytidine(1402)-2'-O)-methyltransferase [Clostridiales bacterium]
MKKGKLYIIATPIGNLDDISFRAIETLKTVDLIIAEDTRHTLKLLNHFNIQKSLSSYHKFNEQTKSENIINKLLNGLNIGLVSDAGTPGICDPGNIIINECIKNNIDVIPVPGACAFLQALICSGFTTNNFSFFGFLSVNKKERKKQLENMSNSTTDLSIIYEAPHKLLTTLQDLLEVLGDRNICISKEITKIHETHYRDTLSNSINYFSENTPKGEYVIIIENCKKNDIIYSMDSKETLELLKDFYILNKDLNSLKDISKLLADKYNLSKKEIYNYLLKIK